jgi:hypothetical protein
MKKSPKISVGDRNERETPTVDAKLQLASFIDKFSPDIAKQAEEVLQKMRELFPTAFELVYDNYNALAIGFSPTERASDTIFSIALYPRWVSLFFLQATGLIDPQKLLKGNGKVAKHIVITTPALIGRAVRALMRDAVGKARVPFLGRGTHRLMIKSISA